MKRSDVLAQSVAPAEERRRRIEAEPLPANLLSLIETAAAECPDRVLLDFFEGGERATYAQLRDQVHALAHGLVGAGVVRGTHVGVMLPNVLAFPVTWLALAAIGAVMIPVNTAYREREVAYVLGDGDAAFLIFHETCRPVVEAGMSDGTIKVPPQRAFVVGGAGDGRFPAWAGLPRPQAGAYVAPVAPSLDDLMNIQYTSGTTGFPKGCMLTQGYWVIAGKVNAARDGRHYEHLLASTPFFYMDPQWLLLMTIYQRGTLHIAARQSASRFMSWVRDHKINFCLLPILAFKQPAHPLDTVNEVVRANVYGISRHLHAAVEERFDLIAREAFGMTELGPTMYMPIEAAEMVGSGACGIPGPFRECRIVDSDGNPVAPGEIGELVVRGTGIFKGYYNRPDATAQAIRDGWFHTGDLFRCDDHGFFYIVGRTKDMIRRSAENIAAREVEAVLTAIDGVLEAAAVAVPDEVRGEEVKAYLVLAQGVQAGEAMLSRIIAHCRENLAPFKVPRYFEFRAALPKTASMKIAKQVLISESGDLRSGSFDRVANSWLNAS